MKLLVEYTGQLRSAIGRAEETVELPSEVTVSALAEYLGSRCNEPARQHLLTASGHMQPSLLIAINGTAHPARQAATTLLRDGDRIVLLPPIAGG